MNQNTHAQVFFGPYIHSKSLNEIEMVEDGFIAVRYNGDIIGVGDKKDYMKWESAHSSLLIHEVILEKNEFLIPGFVDCHIHASQMPNIGLGMDKELLDWLQCHTFPLEIQYSDKAFADHVYSKVVRRTIENGTTFACYYATIHTNSTILLAEQAHHQGQRALVGKVSANCHSPEDYVESTAMCMLGNKTVIDAINDYGGKLVNPIITPRFALCCDKDLMRRLSEMAKKYNINIQTHISENTSEMAEVKKIYGKDKSYAQIYDESNILTHRTILAHAVHLDDAELELIKKRGTSIAHCPASNTNLCSGFCDVKRLLDAGITVGLGTDVSGGNHVSMLSIIRDTLNVSTHLDFVKKHVIVGSGQIKDNPSNLNHVALTYQQAFYLATLGGAEALSEHSVGNFVYGKAFDALIVNPVVAHGPIDDFNLPEQLRAQQETHSTLLKRNFEKFIYTSDDRNILKVFVAGKLIKGTW